jgi:gas vesicle protein
MILVLNYQEGNMDGEMNNGKKGSVAGAVIVSGLIGMAAGAAIGLLLAPKPGKETRAMIAERARALEEAGKKTVESVSNKVKSLADHKMS